MRIIKADDRTARSDEVLSDLDKLQQRYSTATGHQQSVVVEILKQLKKLPELERRIASLENR